MSLCHPQSRRKAITARSKPRKLQPRKLAKRVPLRVVAPRATPPLQRLRLHPLRLVQLLLRGPLRRAAGKSPKRQILTHLRVRMQMKAARPKTRCAYGLARRCGDRAGQRAKLL